MSGPEPARPGETWKEYTERMTDFYAPYMLHNQIERKKKRKSKKKGKKSQ